MVQIVPILFFIDINNTYQLNNKTYSVGLFFKTMKIKHLKFFLRGKGKKKRLFPKVFLKAIALPAEWIIKPRANKPHKRGWEGALGGGGDILFEIRK